MTTKCNRFLRLGMLAISAMTLAGTAQAVDLRDWGRKFNVGSERYVVLAAFNNEAVLDKETQLVWQRQPGPAKAWLYARDYCRTSTTGGREGWRLPSFTELASLVGTGGKLPAGHPFQDLGDQEFFWSRTEILTGVGYAYVKSLLVQYNSLASMSSSYRFLCVRGGGVASDI